MLAHLAPILSLVVVRPWVQSAFPVWDYGEMLPLFHRSTGLWSAFQALCTFTRADGRANYLTYLQLAVNWAIAGDNTVLWQWQRAILMLLAASLFVAVVRRAGGTLTAAVIGGILLPIAVPSTEGWLFIMGEPLAVVLLLLLFLAASGYQHTDRWRMRASLITVLAAAVLLSKEVIGICLPAVIALAVCWIPGTGFRFPRTSPRLYWLTGLLLVVLVLEGWSVEWALSHAVTHAYAKSFAAGSLSFAVFWNTLQAMVLPDRFWSAGAQTALFPANVVYLAVMAAGVIMWLGRGASREGRIWIAGLASCPIAGALLYALWPRYSAFYGIPFFVASAGLFVAALDQIVLHVKSGRWLALAAGLVVIGYSASVSERTVGNKRSIADIAAAIARTFPRLPKLDTVFVVSPRQGGRHWPVTAPELRQYAAAIGVPDSALPVITEATCEAVTDRLHQPLLRNAVLDDHNPCGPLPAVTLQWTATPPYFDLGSWQRKHDQEEVDILAPSWILTRPTR